jgi:hypothetical protein
MANRVTQNVAEVALIPSPTTRVTQVVVEAVVSNATVATPVPGEGKFRVEIDNVSSAMENVVAIITVPTLSYLLADIDFFEQRWYRVTPFDLLGDGIPETISHSYASAASGVIPIPVDPPTSPTTVVVPPEIEDEGYTGEYIDQIYSMYDRPYYLRLL